MNISVAASKIGVSPDTLRKWDERIPNLRIPRDAAGRRRFDDQAVQLLQVVKRLQDQGRSYETIRALLEPPSADVMTAVPLEVRADPRRRWLTAALESAREAAETHAAQVELLARENATLTAEIQALRSRVAELSQSGADLEAQVASAEERIERGELMAAMRKEALKPWWKVW